MKNYGMDIHKFYKESCKEDSRLCSSNANQLEYLTTMKYVKQLCIPGAKILDACAGTGIYSFPLAEAGYDITAGDLVKQHVDSIREQNSSRQILSDIYESSIMDLSRFPDNSFDVVLNLGSFYHLVKEEDRKKAIEESLRVLKPNGLYFMAYLNKYANLAKFRELLFEDISVAEEYARLGYTEEDPIFFASTPEDVIECMGYYPINFEYNIATDGLKFVYKNTLNGLTESDFNKFLDIHYQSCEIHSLLGYSEHCLYIGRKKENG